MDDSTFKACFQGIHHMSIMQMKMLNDINKYIELKPVFN